MVSIIGFLIAQFFIPFKIEDSDLRILMVLCINGFILGAAVVLENGAEEIKQMSLKSLIFELFINSIVFILGFGGMILLWKIAMFVLINLNL